VRQIRDYVEVDNPALFMVSLPQARKDPCFQNFFHRRLAAFMHNRLQLFHPLLDEWSHVRTKYFVKQCSLPAEVIRYQSKIDACARRYVTNGNFPISFCRK
jgi:hypothetical protein